jgi:hypothetical protein
VYIYFKQTPNNIKWERQCTYNRNIIRALLNLTDPYKSYNTEICELLTPYKIKVKQIGLNENQAQQPCLQ